MTLWLAIMLSDKQTAMVILGSIGVVLLFAACIIWNDLFRKPNKL